MSDNESEYRRLKNEGKGKGKIVESSKVGEYLYEQKQESDQCMESNYWSGHVIISVCHASR